MFTFNIYIHTHTPYVPNSVFDFYIYLYVLNVFTTLYTITMPYNTFFQWSL